MAALTKAQIRTAIRQAFDDANSKRWSDANLDVLIAMVEDTMFQTILDTWDYATHQLDATLTPSGTGVVALSALTKRFYRVQAVIKNSDSSDVQPKLYREAVPQSSYYILGDSLYTEPAITGASSLSVAYAFLPAKFTTLADGDALPDYPEGHEAALIYLTAAWAITKGDAESMQQIGRIADTALEALLTHIARRYPIGAQQRIAQVKASLMRNPLVSQTAQQG